MDSAPKDLAFNHEKTVENGCYVLFHKNVNQNINHNNYNKTNSSVKNNSWNTLI